MARMLHQHPTVTNPIGLCLMLESCLGFLVRWSHILSPTCGLIAPLNPCGII
ncbi:hypothetical protein Patl1_34522 [Pistacia atlantica]|uniref:Uncharacterized protein n=1 Tax=Pistacia atlantica TaxID=434234 RepID=A0ACC0ZRM9_9ROSI|nr:hypothetical protein Patl1_34522 [Pistacia atlantica]